MGRSLTLVRTAAGQTASQQRRAAEQVSKWCYRHWEEGELALLSNHSEKAPVQPSAGKARPAWLLMSNTCVSQSVSNNDEP